MRRLLLLRPLIGVLMLIHVGIQFKLIRDRAQTRKEVNEILSKEISSVQQASKKIEAITKEMKEQERLRDRAIREGNLCVAFDSSNEIAFRWKPRTEYGVKHCPDSDTPKAAKGMPSGMLWDGR